MLSPNLTEALRRMIQLNMEYLHRPNVKEFIEFMRSPDEEELSEDPDLSQLQAEESMEATIIKANELGLTDDEFMFATTVLSMELADDDNF
jgi:hypothetical protein